MAGKRSVSMQSRDLILVSTALLIACATGCNDTVVTPTYPSTTGGASNTTSSESGGTADGTAGGTVGDGTGNGGASNDTNGQSGGQGGTSVSSTGNGGTASTTTSATNPTTGGVVGSGGNASTAFGGATAAGGASQSGASGKANVGGSGQGGRVGQGGAAGGKATTATGGRAQGGAATGGATVGTTAAGGAAGSGTGTLSAAAQEYVDAHNAIRAAVTKPDNYTGTWVPLPNVTWSDTVAASAQAWVNKLRDEQNCGLVHEGSGTGYGENLASGTNLSPTAAVNLWAGEKSKYTWSATYTVADFNAGSGHYTQVVWRKSTQIGCASATCGTNRVVISCRYSPPGNVTGGTQAVY